ncbi:Hypothetical predicted protein [Prunus dulcis]|uniref:Uncharacterized protein n=1 Tax=Prunus dulcis TaxID=3755 RepID=A0A5E4GFJ7_PRUDU|nr:hypothetical protein L3X38_003821 [Prunus dulcis]VVA38308.1 Hypothetical predicted protein [Prunus dulcis]
MRFIELHAFNKAFLAKQRWRIICNLNALWVLFGGGAKSPNPSTFLTTSNGQVWSWKEILSQLRLELELRSCDRGVELQSCGRDLDWQSLASGVVEMCGRISGGLRPGCGGWSLARRGWRRRLGCA